LAELPSITIVTPSLNAVATIGQALASVAEQDYPGAVEHIVIDGGSTDGTVEVARAAGVHVVSEPDRGLADALNKGLRLARHEIFGELNADDLYLPGALRAVGEAMAAHPETEWVTGPCLIVDGDGREIRPLISRYKDFFLRRWSYRLHLVQNFVSAPSTFVRTDALRAVGGYDERFLYSMDYDVWLRLGRRSAPVVLAQPLASFRMAGSSLSLTGFEQQFREHAANAREHGGGHPGAVLANRVLSRAIVGVYRLMRVVGRARGGAPRR
jgi:glycosyltransferase involved in cell wall biosynthesis